MSKDKNEKVQEIADVFKALSNPNRLRIFLRLVACCVPGTVHEIEDDARTCVGDLGKDLEIVPSTVSHHIKELHRAGLISMRRKGQKIECWIDPKVLEELSRFFAVK